MKKILLSLTAVCLLFACSDSGSSNNSASGNNNSGGNDDNWIPYRDKARLNSDKNMVKIREEVDNLIKTSLESEELIFMQCKEEQILKNPTNEDAVIFYLDRYLQMSEIYSNEYTTKIVGKQYPILPNDSAYVHMDYYSNDPNSNPNPYTFIAFVPKDKMEEVKSFEREILEDRNNYTALYRQVTLDILNIIKPYTKVYKYTYAADYNAKCFDREWVARKLYRKLSKLARTNFVTEERLYFAEQDQQERKKLTNPRNEKVNAYFLGPGYKGKGSDIDWLRGIYGYYDIDDPEYDDDKNPDFAKIDYFANIITTSQQYEFSEEFMPNETRDDLLLTLRDSYSSYSDVYSFVLYLTEQEEAVLIRDYKFNPKYCDIITENYENNCLSIFNKVFEKIKPHIRVYKSGYLQ